jgi:hypothetical protein
MRCEMTRKRRGDPLRLNRITLGSNINISIAENEMLPSEGLPRLDIQ